MAIGHFNMNALLQVVEVAGIIAFASSGLIEARNKQMDAVGVFTVAFITAFGGGTLRDLLLDRRPLFWVEHQEYLMLIFVMTLVGIPLLKHVRSTVAERLLVYVDALGLGLFSVTGASLAADASMPLVVCVMMGVMTGIVGGVLRDVICNEIPMVFRRGQLYATCSFFGCWVFLICSHLASAQAVALIAGILVTFIMRLAALHFNLKLPS